MAFHKSKGFKYLKNFIIGVGASVVMIGALAKILSHPLGNVLITAGLLTEAFLFLMLGVLPPEKDYYWEKLYPGIENYNSNIAPLTAGPQSKALRPLDADAVETRLGGMLDELQGMSKSLGSLKALQEVDFSETKGQMESMNNFYSQMNAAMSSLTETVEDTKIYKEQIASLNRNLTSLNSVYGNVLGAFRKGIE
ncbi:MAG: gliding motility protein GldL [Saprospiraceae bacterium]|nr:gliding motility protein GldL [Bacteroidia bacterium]NNE16328.1 gliding motility protein GldL [Saprospiraceae bacterium]NNL93938.1 gliding motility protein GldL [Saprospiraceae bacterium]